MQQDDLLSGVTAGHADDSPVEDAGWGASTDETPGELTPAGIWGEGLDEEGDPEDSGPNWLKGLPSIDSGELVNDGDPQADSNKAQVPTWLQGMQPEDSADIPEAPSFDAVEEDSPDWLNGYEEEQASAPASVPEIEIELPDSAEAVDQGAPGTPKKSGEGSLPNWLENLKFSPDDSQQMGGDDEAFSENFVQDDVSALLFEPDDLPDWLDEEDPDKPIEIKPPPSRAEIEPPPETEEEDIAPAELPSWLQAMRPIEAAADSGGSMDQVITHSGVKEQGGPLAGLSDVLPAEPHVVLFSNKSLPITGFELSEAQKTYTRILKTMVDAETVNPPIQRRKMALPQHILRWVISFLIMAAVFFGSWGSSETFALPQKGIPPEESAVISQIESLNSSSHVLIAFEYQPGFSGEMESSAYAVIDHLLQRGVKLSVVSTQPIGPGLADRFLKNKMGHHPYISQLQYSNLGYLAGGAAGLLNFAANPRMAISPMDAQGQNLWGQDPLNAIQNIRSFAMVMVITDDPDIARIWVEQVQPFLDPTESGSGTPLVMIVSAQAEPLVYPYYQSNPKQVAGIVSGVVGGAFYEVTYTGVSQREGTANNYWFAYNIAILIAIALISGISVINFVGVLFRSRKKPDRRGNF